MANYYYSGQESRLERISWRMWITETICFVFLVLLTTVSSFAALSSSAGFPCFFGTVGESNFGRDVVSETIGTGHRDVKIFFISSTATQFVVFSALFVWIVLVVYLMLGCIRVKMCNYDPSYGASELATAVANMPALVSLIICVWLWQVFVLLLSYRQVTLAAVTFCVIFIVGSIFLGAFTSGGKSPENYNTFNFQLKAVCKDVHVVVTAFKAVVMNLFTTLLSIWIMVLALLGAVVMVLNFEISISTAAVGAFVAFIVIGILYLLTVELLISRYVHVLLGPHLGMIISLGILGVTALNYSKTLDVMLYPSWKPITTGILGAFAVIVLTLGILRAVRSYRFHHSRQTRFLQRVNTVAGDVKGRIMRKKKGNVKAYVKTAPYSDDPAEGETVIYETVPYEDVTYQNLPYEGR
ncbi:Envelope glycoprotein M [Cacatuid alphaherpesvirus 2]|uniref:Envelope glycoprotein M n=1 Tax=Cacatuid alphaherpesvirus 2 TaxID=2604840 RepID=A0A5B9R043_9ALPH|nr:Envelope glycoprotein M [Cacatuid alphaherpesvirus 2]QEG54072.1 Envelope glycoprotein M [Cacatuid alphaherpesvirus 2]